MRFHSWLPHRLEPDYKEGYICDKCKKESSEGAIFHGDSTGTDYCLECAESLTLDVFHGLISSVSFFDDCCILSDGEVNNVALFAYRINKTTLGFYFSDASSILCQVEGNTVVGNCVRLRNGVTETIREKECKERLPWIHHFGKNIQNEIILHPTPEYSMFSPEKVFVQNFLVNNNMMALQLNNNYAQVFDAASGTEVIARGGVAIAMFRNWRCVLSEKEYSTAQDIVNGIRVNT